MAGSASVRPAEAPSPVSVSTITMADVHWRQGDRETARRIVREILSREPGNARALAWIAERDTEEGAPGAAEGPEKALLEFLETMAKEYGYDLSRPH